jgi:hypothetical protein
VAFRHGKTAYVSVNAVDLSTFCDSADIDFDIDTGDTTTFQSSWKSALGGIPGAKAAIGGKYDPTASTGPQAVLVAIIAGGVAVPIVYRPGGTLTGQVQRSFSALLTSYSESSPVGGIVTFKTAFLATGAVTSTIQ